MAWSQKREVTSARKENETGEDVRKENVEMESQPRTIAPEQDPQGAVSSRP